MKITVDRTALTRAARLAADVADKRSAHDAVKLVQLRVTDSLRVSATDLTTSVDTVVEADGKLTAGALAVDAGAFCAVVKSLEAPGVSLVTDDRRRLTIASGNARVTLPGYDVEQVPRVFTPDLSQLHEVDAAVLGAILRRASYSVGESSGRADFTAVVVESDGSTLLACGVSSHRISEQKAPTAVPPFEALAPNVGVSRITSALEGHATARLGLQGGHLVCAVGAATISTRALDAKRIPYEQIFEAYSTFKYQNVVRVDREELMRAVRRGALVSDRDVDRKLDGFTLVVRGDKVTVTNSNPEAGEVSTTIDLAAPAVADVSVCLTWRYLAESLSMVDTDEVELSLGTELEPIVVRPPGVETEVHLIMVRAK